MRDRPAAVADGSGGKLREKADQNTRFFDKKSKLSKDPPRPPVRVAKGMRLHLALSVVHYLSIWI
ncbi:unnamed protein product [Dibothriocephalus latus]|uniref:Uncharacterized protein n=1 Tax=Dibothriocephalus latus TaxID=60516 RepID=A0A3P7MTA2_DIBLA|nr:unnamed protein product [Dibothriocephalus latus]